VLCRQSAPQSEWREVAVEIPTSPALQIELRLELDPNCRRSRCGAKLRVQLPEVARNILRLCRLCLRFPEILHGLRNGTMELTCDHVVKEVGKAFQSLKCGGSVACFFIEISQPIADKNYSNDRVG
jgi:hypothetical protein